MATTIGTAPNSKETASIDTISVLGRGLSHLVVINQALLHAGFSLAVQPHTEFLSSNAFSI